MRVCMCEREREREKEKEKERERERVCVCTFFAVLRQRNLLTSRSETPAFVIAQFVRGKSSTTF
jgi:hypothetical protein